MCEKYVNGQTSVNGRESYDISNVFSPLFYFISPLNESRKQAAESSLVKHTCAGLFIKFLSSDVESFK